MHNGDVLGDEGRKALNACVKVKIYGKPETRRYFREKVVKRVRGCYASWYPHLFGFEPVLDSEGQVQAQVNPFSWCEFDSNVRDRFSLKCEELFGDPEMNRTYDILDVYNAVVQIDEMSYVQKYPGEGPGSDELKDLINKRRADVEREYKEATADPNGRHKYSWVVAQRRVRDCYAGNFVEDEPMFKVTTCNIIDIHEAVAFYDEESFAEKYPSYDDSSKREEIDAQRANVEKEYAETVAAVNSNLELTLRMYSQDEAEKCVQGCYHRVPHGAAILPFKVDDSGTSATSPSYNIFDIHEALLRLEGRKKLEKYPEEGPGSDELTKLIDIHRDNLKEEYEKALSALDNKPFLHEYTQPEAERRVRDCFAGSLLHDTDIFPTKKYESGLPKVYQTYDIFDIREALGHFDARKFVIKYPEERPGDDCPKVGLKYDEVKKFVNEQRADIRSEYITATANIEIEHGSGFIVHDHFIITNRHVIETYLDKPESHEIYITNAAIGDRELVCEVAHYDAGKDLALLYCPDLNLEQSGICPLLLSSHSLLPGMSIFSFGYPMSHTGETALFVSGNVSGSKKTLAGHSMVVLNCSLNSGNTGGPVMCWVNGQLRVVGVATQKHFKEILTFEEREAIEHIRKSLQTRAIPDVPKHVEENCSFFDYYEDLRNHQTPMFLLTLKLYDALETHSQFNLSNALPGHLVVDFIKDSVSKCTGEYKEELAEVMKLSEVRVNILPSGHLYPSQCCVQ